MKVCVEIDCKINNCFEIVDVFIYKYFVFVRKLVDYLYNSNECRNEINIICWVYGYGFV